MKRVIRREVFETNSSSNHVLSMPLRRAVVTSALIKEQVKPLLEKGRIVIDITNAETDCRGLKEKLAHVLELIANGLPGDGEIATLEEIANAPETKRLDDFLKRTTGYNLLIEGDPERNWIEKYGGSLINDDQLGEIWEPDADYDFLMREFLFNPDIYIFDDQGY